MDQRVKRIHPAGLKRTGTSILHPFCGRSDVQSDACGGDPLSRKPAKTRRNG